MKTRLGTYTGVPLINLLHETCSLYDLELKRKTRKVVELFTTPTKSYQRMKINQSASPINNFLIVRRASQLGTILPMVEV